MKGWVCLVAALLVCMGASAAPPRWAHRRFPLHVLHPRDKRFWIMAAVQTAAMVADVETTERGFQQNQFAEGNPIFGGERPGRLKLYSILGGAEAAELWSEHYLKKSSDGNPREGQWKWWTIAAVHTGFHGAAAIHNAMLLSRPYSPPGNSRNAN